jgi:neopullulanase
MNNRCYLRAVSRACALNSVLILSVVGFAAAVPANGPTVSKVEPPNWWTNYSSPVMVLLYGDKLNAANITTDYPGITIDKVQTETDEKHAFVWLKIDANTQPGTVAIRVRNAFGDATATMQLSARPPEAGRYQGVTRDDVIYLIMPDRFADGDPSNDQPPQAAPGTYDRKAAKAYHGGDLKGVQQHLPYLKNLGVTTLWLTPLYQNDDATSDYHGYGAVDEYAVEDHFGTMDDVRNLVAAAHQSGMKVLFDMVPNHVGPRHPWANSPPTSGWLHGTPAHHLDNANYDFPPVSDPHAVSSNYVEALDGWFVNTLPDLAQENPLVATYLLQNVEWWTESSGIDGIRIDTFPYVPRSFWSYYDQGLVARYPNFFMVGEVNDTDATVTSYWAGGQTGFDGIDTHLTTPFDFPMFQAISDVVARGQSAKKIVSVLRQDRFYPHPELLVTLLDNHDRPRFITQANGSPEKLKLGISLLLTLRGIPQLYSGDEIGLPGGEDPDNRRDFPGGFPGDTNNAFTQAGRTPEQQDIFAHTQILVKLRQQHPALRTGKQEHVAVGDRYYAFTRQTEGDRLLIIFYNAATPETLNVDLAGTSISDVKQLASIFGPSTAKLKDGLARIQVAPYSLTIFEAK